MKIIVSDIEGTLTTGSSWKGLRTFYKDHYSPWIYNLFFARWIPRYLLVGMGMMSRKAAMVDWMLDEIKLFKGFSKDKFKQMAEWVVDQEMWEKRMVDVVQELENARKDGIKIAVVSGAYQPIVDSFAEKLDAIPVGSPLVYQDERVVGVQLPINSYEQKVQSIKEIAGEGEILAAYGDSLSDLPMLAMSQEPVAVYPGKQLRMVAKERGWRIIE
jgi:HAD superfamily phosphoserine phosphatase-like hydrolase